jgi:hypothetical protein
MIAFIAFFVFFCVLFITGAPLIYATGLNITFDKNSLCTKGGGSNQMLGSDQWAMTWHSDGNLYAAWGDGDGWDSSGDCFLGITRISGTPPGLTGTDLFCQPRPGSVNIKSHGIFSVGKTIYLFYQQENQGWTTTSGALSTDNGASLTLKEPMWAPADGVQMHGMVVFGPGHTGLPENLDSNYIYGLFSRTEGPMDGPVFLARGKTSDPLNKANWEWFTGLSGTNASWGAQAGRKAIISNIVGLDWHFTIMTYNAPLKKYLLTYFAGKNGQLHVLAADQPWGPFEEIYTGDMGVDDKWKFTVQVMPNTISADGRSMWFSFSGYPEWDKVGFIKATITGDTPTDQPTKM